MDEFMLKMLVEPAADVDGTWTAHVLDFDVISFGDGFQHAVMNGIEAALMCVEDDRAEGLDSFECRPKAALEVFQRMGQIMATQNPMRPLEEIEQRIAAGERFAVAVIASVQPAAPQPRVRPYGQLAPAPTAA